MPARVGRLAWAVFARPGQDPDVARRSIWPACLALVAIDLVSRASYLAPRLVTARGLLNYLTALVALAVAVRLVALAPHARRVWLFAAFIALPMTIQWAMFRAYGAFVAPADFVALADSPRVVLGATRQGTGVVTLLSFALTLACAWLLPREARPLRWYAIVPGITLLAAASGLGAVYWRASATLEHPLPAFSCALAGLVKRETVRASGARAVVPKDPAAERLPSIVLIVGESLAASHLGIYGYDRDTTPRLQRILDRGDLVALRDASVMGPNTRSSVPYILTGLEGPDPDGRVSLAPTVLEYAKARGYHTAFVSAQEESWGNFDVLFREGTDTFLSGIRFAPEVGVLKGADDLVVLEQGALPLLATIEAPFFVVLHMDGSHVPYGTHSPASHKVFMEDGANSVGAYDNTVRVTDEYLARVLEAVRGREPGAWMFFTSDHGQPLGEGGAFFNHGYQTNVVRDPLLVFPPPSADHSPAARDSQWSEIATAQVSACDLAPTILHLMKASLAAPMDCVDWLAHAPKPRVRVVSAYTPTWVSEPTMLLLMPDGERALYELQHGTVTMNDGLERPMSEIGIPAEVSHRLH